MSTPFNILYIHEMPGFAGAENSILNLVEHLDKSRFKAFFVLPEDGVFAGKLRKLGINVQFVKMPRYRFILGASATIKSLKHIIREQNIDLVHSHSIRSNIYGALAAKSEKIPIVWHARTLIEKDVFDLDRIFSFLPDKIICNSKAVSRRFEKNGKVIRKAQVIYNGVDLQKFKPGINAEKVKKEFDLKEDTVVIGIASRFSKNKGHEYFLREARILKDALKGIRIKFLVMGSAVFREDEYREKYLKKMTDNLGLGDSVIFSGFREDMPELFNALDVFVLTSKAEACGRVLLEAMASGKPMVGTNTGGTPELVPDGIAGVLVSPFKAGALSTAIIHLLMDDERRREMGLAARTWAERNFGIEKNVSETERIYLELIKNRQGA